MIDTQACLTPHHAVATETADLILMPFIGRKEAETVAANLEGAGDRAPIFGVDAGVGGTAVQRRLVAELYGAPMLHTVLPRSDLLACMLMEGRLDRLVTPLDERDCDRAPEAPGFAQAWEMYHAWTQVQELATEVQWMLQCYTLERARIDWPPCTTVLSCERPFLI
ncbi:MAG: hypothetical protein Q4P24_12345 [Rhodobacterales bacterium]|nr:hypothetical protein [Rhodobacterales bacterium]